MSNVHKEYDQAEKDLEDLKINGYKLKRHQFVGDTHYYKCEKNCPVRMYLKLDQESSKCFLHVTIIGLAIKNETGRKSKKMKNKISQEEVIEIRSLIKTFYLMTRVVNFRFPFPKVGSFHIFGLKLIRLILLI